MEMIVCVCVCVCLQECGSSLAVVAVVAEAVVTYTSKCVRASAEESKTCIKRVNKMCHIHVQICPCMDTNLKQQHFVELVSRQFLAVFVEFVLTLVTVHQEPFLVTRLKYIQRRQP